MVQTTPENLAGPDIVFLAFPHGASGAIWAQVPASNAQAALDPLFLMPSSAVLDTAPAKAELQRLLVELLK